MFCALSPSEGERDAPFSVSAEAVVHAVRSLTVGRDGVVRKLDAQVDTGEEARRWVVLVQSGARCVADR